MDLSLIVRFNIHVQTPLSPERLAELQTILYEAALWACDDDPEVFYTEKDCVIGVSISTDDDRLSILEAGSVLGQCQLAYEKFGESVGPTWLSVHAADESLIDSAYIP